MSNSDRIAALQQKHSDIENQLRLLDKQPGTAEADIIVLKKTKLAIKDEIQLLSEVETTTA